MKLTARPGDYLHAVAGQQNRAAQLTLFDPQGRKLLHVDSLTAAADPPWPAEEVHWVAATPGVYRIELTLPPGFHGPCDLELVEHRPATAADRQRTQAEADLARGHALRRTRTSESCRAGIAPYESAERRFADLGWLERRAEALLGLGQLQRQCLRENQAALQTFLRAEPLFTGNPAFEAIVRQNRGKLRDALGDLDGAIAEYRRALELHHRLGQRALEAETANNLGLALQIRGHYDESASLFDRALALQQTGDDPHELAKTLLNRGHLHRELRETGRAQDRLSDALAQSRHVKDSDLEAQALTALGLLALDTGQPKRALHPLQEALRLRPPGTRGRAVTLTSLGVALRQLGRLDDARQAYLEALPIYQHLGDVREETRSLGNLGRLDAATGHPEEAIHHFDRAQELFHTLSAPPDLAWILEGKPWVLRHRGDLEGARRLMEEALALAEQHRYRQTDATTRAEFLATRQDSYGFLIDLLMEMHQREPEAGYAAAALDVNERSLARSLLDGLVTGADVPRPWRTDDVRRELLDRDTVLLEYRLGTSRSFLWAVTPDAVHSFTLPGRATIEQPAGHAARLLPNSRSRQDEISAELQLARLSRWLLAPAAPLLAGKRLLVVGDGALLALPFAVLPEPKTSPQAGEPLIAHHEIVTLPSISVLGELRRATAGRPAPPGALWLLADPDFAGRFPQLPFSREEAQAILALSPPSGRRAVLGREARRATVLDSPLRDYRILHFATHGAFGTDEPGGGRLVLAQVDPQGRPEADGFLHLADIYKLDLRADLVVLSACGSALGRQVRGEGMMGMTRGLFQAGAERVLASLWNVNDRAAVELMRRFYHHLLAEGLAPPAALREAQNAIRRQPHRRSPYYWAGFTLQGEWRRD